MVLIEFKHDCPLPPFEFPKGWVGKMCICGDMLYSEEDIYEEGEEDGEHTFYPTLQRSTKVYTLKTGLLNDSQLETLYYLPLFDSVAITLETGERLPMKHISIEHDYPFDNKYQSQATIRFNIGEVLTKTTCCQNMGQGLYSYTAMTTAWTCEDATSYARMLEVTVYKYLDGVYASEQSYSIIDAFGSYSAITETQYSELSLSNFMLRANAFIAYLQSVEGSFVFAASGFRQFNPACAVVVGLTRKIEVVFTRGNGDGMAGDVVLKKGVTEIGRITVSTSDLSTSVVFDNLDDEPYWVDFFDLNLTEQGTPIGTMKSWSKNGVLYVGGNEIPDIRPNVQGRRVYGRLEVGFQASNN